MADDHDLITENDEQPRFVHQVRALVVEGMAIEEIAAALDAPRVTVLFLSELFRQTGALPANVARRLGS
ncbi:hypothetical protein [Paracoccus sp. 22332]|uniref:hypothetical protein n=1 Tax=Paracoccus sp. 22332 TaxID=3453913 RepID=UPI003F862285